MCIRDRNKCVAGNILIQEEVRKEIYKKDDKLSSWFKKNDLPIIKTDLNITEKVKNINDNFINLTKESRGRSLADPFVIALGEIEKATVVTMENTGSENKPKIPFVCNKMKIKQTNLYEYLKLQKIKFGID